MEAVHFQAEVGSDNVIRVPEGVVVPTGPVRVTVVSCSRPQDAAITERPNPWNWMLEMAKEAEQIETDLPCDLAENHDFYISGKPRK